MFSAHYVLVLLELNKSQVDSVGAPCRSYNVMKNAVSSLNGCDEICFMVLMKSHRGDVDL